MVAPSRGTQRAGSPPAGAPGTRSRPRAGGRPAESRAPGSHLRPGAAARNWRPHQKAVGRGDGSPVAGRSWTRDPAAELATWRRRSLGTSAPRAFLGRTRVPRRRGRAGMARGLAAGAPAGDPLLHPPTLSSHPLWSPGSPPECAASWCPRRGPPCPAPPRPSLQRRPVAWHRRAQDAGSPAPRREAGSAPGTPPRQAAACARHLPLHRTLAQGAPARAPTGARTGRTEQQSRRPARWRRRQSLLPPGLSCPRGSP